MILFEKGDVVRLTQKAVKGFTNHEKKTGKIVAWNKRIGIVRHCNNYSVSVRWSDRKTDDWLPVKALELAEPPCPLSTAWCLF
jgi:hypothetical protein